MYRVFYGPLEHFKKDFKKHKDAKEFLKEHKGWITYIDSDYGLKEKIIISVKDIKFKLQDYKKRNKYDYYSLFNENTVIVGQYNSYKEAKEKAKSMKKYFIAGSFNHASIYFFVSKKGKF